MSNIIDLIDVRNEMATSRYEDFVNELEDLAHGGCITYTGHRVGAAVAQHFDWLNINEHGAPLYVPHRVLLQRLPFGRDTLYRGGRELAALGLITTVGNTWHAAVGERYV